jgi:hypothetical protein
MVNDMLNHLTVDGAIVAPDYSTTPSTITPLASPGMNFAL